MIVKKSYVRDIGHSDVFISDIVYRRMQLDADELFQALEENAVEDLVREVLRPEFGMNLLFHYVVAAVLRTVMFRLADELRKPARPERCGNLIVIINHSDILKSEKQFKERSGPCGIGCYWSGESCQIDETYKGEVVPNL